MFLQTRMQTITPRWLYNLQSLNAWQQYCVKSQRMGYTHYNIWHLKMQIKPNRRTDFSNLFWHETLHVSDSSSLHHQEFIHYTLSNGICHTGLQRAFEENQDDFHSDPARKLSTNLYDIYHC